MQLLLFGGIASGHILPSEEKIHNSACLQQVGEAAEHRRRSRPRGDGAEISPRRGYQRRAAVRQQ
jgi:hypothetical protein